MISIVIEIVANVFIKGNLIFLLAFSSRRIYREDYRSVVQPGRALAWGARSRWFESSHSDQ